MISHGQQLLGDYLKALTGIAPEFDAHPPWLGHELDLFYPQFDLAFEFQGHHHFAPINGRRAFTLQREADNRKAKLCDDNGVVLVRVAIADLHHPTLTDFLIRRLIQSYGSTVGRHRFFHICGQQDPTKRIELMRFNRDFKPYQHAAMLKARAHPAGSVKEMRQLRQSIAR